MSTLSTTNLKHPSSGSNNIVLDSSGNTRVTAITDSAGANSSTPEAIANGTAKAWVNFNGTGTVAIRASYNVSSITDDGVGRYIVNLTTAMPDANYAAFTNANSFSDTDDWAGSTGSTGIAYLKTSSSFRVDTYTGVYRDSAICDVAIFR